MDLWHPEDKAMFPDYYAKRKKWYEVRRKTWSEEMKWLQEWDKKNEENVRHQIMLKREPKCRIIKFAKSEMQRIENWL